MRLKQRLVVKAPLLGCWQNMMLSNMNQIADLGQKESERKSPWTWMWALLGVASLAAAVGLKDYLIETRTGGTIICLDALLKSLAMGKHILLKLVFKGVDAMLAWHPSDTTSMVIKEH